MSLSPSHNLAREAARWSLTGSHSWIEYGISRPLLYCLCLYSIQGYAGHSGGGYRHTHYTHTHTHSGQSV